MRATDYRHILLLNWIEELQYLHSGLRRETERHNEVGARCRTRRPHIIEAEPGNRSHRLRVIYVIRHEQGRIQPGTCSVEEAGGVRGIGRQRRLPAQCSRHNVRAEIGKLIGVTTAATLGVTGSELKPAKVIVTSTG